MNEYEQSLIEKERNYTVVKSNMLVLNTRYQYSLNQQKTLAYICSKIKPVSDRGKYQLDYTFSIAEYLQLLGVESSGNQYTLIKDTLQSLSDKSMWIPIEDENGVGEVLVRWLSNVALYPRQGTIKIKLDEYLAPYLFELQERYLSYGLINILNFKSKYSIRIYEMLKAYYDMKRSYYRQQRYDTPVIDWTIDIDKLKHMLMLDTENEKNKYKNFKDFRKNVLETAQSEINELTDLYFDFEQIRKGRGGKVVKIKFIIKYKAPAERVQCANANRTLLETPKRPKKKKPSVIILDTETTGADTTTAEILQLSIIDEDGNTLFNEYFKPLHTRSWSEAERIHGITPERVSSCKTIDDYREQVQAILDGAETIIAYNANFDLALIENANFKISGNTKVVDVMLDFAEIYGEWNEKYGNFKWQTLKKCAEYYDFDWSETSGAHNSLADCKATLHCYRAIKEGEVIPY